MTTDFLHGIESVSVDSGVRPVQTIRSSIIGLIGTAPDADAAVFPLNTPVLVNSRPSLTALGSDGTLYDAINGVLDQFGAFIVVIRVAEGTDDNDTMVNIIGSEDPSSGALTGIQAFRQSENLFGFAPMLLIAPGFTGARPSGVSAISVGTPGTGYTSAPAVTFTGGSGEAAAGVAVLTNGISITPGSGGSGYSSAPTVVIGAPPAGGVQATATASVTANAISGITVTNPGKGYLTPPAVSFTGGGGTGGTATASLTGRVGSVRITNPGVGYVSAPTIGFTGGGGSAAAATATVAAGANPVVSGLLALANQLRAHVIAEGPNTTDSEALAYRADWSSRRVFIVDPATKVLDSTLETPAVVDRPNSPRVVGRIARTDYEVGFWASPSNQEIVGITGLGRAIDFAQGNPNTRANLLNENQIATIIRDDGWRLWGNRTASTDPKWAFLSVSRTADMIDLSIVKAHRWAVDKAITKSYLADVTGSVNAYLRDLKARGAILGGRCWVDPALNGADQIAAGHVTFSYDFTPPAPAERITFRSTVTSDYIASIFA